ncbi:MAG: RDD family protein [Armatimonadota bacterium]|nr:RDD family protein [Armatimonadota bacterium]
MVDDERVQLYVPEQIEVSYQLAGLGSRFLAAAIDTFIVGVGTLLLAFVVFIIRARLTGQGLVSAFAGLIALSAAILIYIAYYMFFELTRSGKSPGKTLTGLRVISTDGAPISAEQSAVRNILRIADWLPIFYAAGVISLLVTARNQRLGDLAAGTMVVKERLAPMTELPEEEPEAPELPPEVSGEVLRMVRAGARTVTREEERTIRRFLERRFDLAPQARRRLASRLADTLRRRFPGLQFGQLRNPETFLEVVIRAIDEQR